MKIRNTFSVIFYSMFCLILSGTPFSASAAETMQLTASPYSFFGYAVLLVFAAAYVLVFAEEHLGLRKSKPVLVAAGLIWILVSIAYAQNDNNAEAIKILRHNTLEYAELLFFLLAAMSYINSMVERGVFDVLRHKLVSSELSLRGLFWTTGVLAFFLSPIADNLTTAMVMGTVVISIGKNYKKFVTGACINIVIAANAGGAFSPFGDITTLMVWQKGVVSFGEFFALFIPSLINWLVPAFLISLTVEKKTPRIPEGFVEIKRGGRTICALFAATIITTVLLHHLLALPPFFGMMFGLGALKIYGYFLQLQEKRTGPVSFEDRSIPQQISKPYDVFDSLRAVEWDTLLFFYGIILCVGGLGAMGYLGLVSHYLYVDLGTTNANILVGILSAVVDNIPLTFAVLSMQPEMDLDQWLLFTLTVGTGGSLLAIGSAAGVALMGMAKNSYTFMSHLKWSWAILLGYGASIVVHLIMSSKF